MGILAIIGWTCGNMAVFFGIFKALKMLRIPPEEEEMVSAGAIANNIYIYVIIYIYIYT